MQPFEITTREQLIMAWSQDKAALVRADEALRDNELVLLIGAQVGAHLSMASQRLRQDAPFWTKVCAHWGGYYLSAHPSIKTNVDLASCAVDNGLAHKYLHARVRWEPKVLQALIDRTVRECRSFEWTLADAHPSLSAWCKKQRINGNTVQGQQQLIQYGHERKALRQAKLIALRAFQKQAPNLNQDQAASSTKNALRL